MRLTLAQVALFVVLTFPQTFGSSDAQIISLEKKLLPATGKLEGISNIFFEKIENDKVHYPPDWKEVEMAPLLENPSFAPIHVIRYKDASGKTKYVVDTNGDLNFEAESVLQFQQHGNIEIADVEVEVRSVGSGGIPWKMNYQIILSNDGYTYARISEYRQGSLRLGKNTYRLRLRPRGRNNPQFSLSGETVCLIDLNHDGEFSERWRLSDQGKVLQGEEINLSAPFILAGKKLRIVELDARGTRLKVQPTSEEISISPGFKAPDFKLVGLDNKSYNLEDLKGKIVLLEFWSTTCPFCEHILPQVNSLIRKNRGQDFIALAISREANPEEVRNYLKNHPCEAPVVLGDRATWQTYNSQGITPAYYLIDRQGRIQFSGYGASPELIQVIDKKIRELRIR